MSNVRLLLVPTFFALAACSSGNGTFTSRANDDFSITVPVPNGTAVQYPLTIADAESTLVNVGDRVGVFHAKINGLDGQATVTKGDTKANGLTVYTVEITDVNNQTDHRFFLITNNLEASLTVDPTVTNTTVRTRTVNSVPLIIETGTDGSNFSRLSASSGDSESFTIQKVVTGILQEVEFTSTAQGSTQVLNLPSGSFSYSGIGAVQWRDFNTSSLKTAHGDVTMDVNFTAGTGSIDGRNLQGLLGVTADFYGDIAIDATSGHFGSTTATIVVDNRTGAAGILGTFNADASQVSGTVFTPSPSSGGSNPNGVFTLVRQ